jgi:retron-type reverse transcriptase
MAQRTGAAMKRYGNLWETIVSWENFVRAAKKAHRGKKGRLDVQRFNFKQEYELLELRHELINGSYQCGIFVTHWIREPKPRLISAAPYRDRVVHHALMNVLEPILNRHFHPDSYACRGGKGSHAAADRLQSLMRCYRYALKCDLRKFFPSIDHQIIKQTFRRLIKDKKTLALMDMIVDSSNQQEPVLQWFAGDDLFAPVERRKGLPIGNLTSQWFANWMLSDFDHYMTSVLGLGGYVRYCDDFIILHNDRKRLREAIGQIRAYLQSKRLSLHPAKVHIRPVAAGVTFVGYRIWPTHRLLRKQNVRRFNRRLVWMKRGYACGMLDPKDIKQRLASWIGYACHADTKRLIRRMSRQWRFARGKAEANACFPRRQLEQQCQQLHGYQPQQQHAIKSEQQHRVPSRPALSKIIARNCAIHGLRKRSSESPGLVPVRSFTSVNARRIYAVGHNGAGSILCERPDMPLGLCA